MRDRYPDKNKMEKRLKGKRKVLGMRIYSIRQERVIE